MTDAGWHPDPAGRSDHRYYDGNRWAEHVSDAAGTQSVDPVGAPGDGLPPAPPSSSVPAEDDRGPATAGQMPWGGAGPRGDAGLWPANGPGGAAPPARKKVDKISVAGLVLALVGIGIGLASLFALPWLDVGGTEIDFFDARQGVDDTGLFGAAAGGLMINIAYFIVAVGGVVAVAKAFGSRKAGIVGLVLAVVGLAALIAIGVAAIPIEGSDAVGGNDFATVLQSEGEDRLTETAVFTGVVMFISTVLAGVGLLLHGIAGRIPAFLGLALVALFACGGIFVLRENYTDLAFGLATADLGLGAWAIVASAIVLAISTAIPGGRKEV